ncbi:MAG: type II secretion system minor pseudopilin GspJ [Glaciecola sp.]
MKYTYQNKPSSFILDCPEFSKPKLKHIKINGFTLIEVIIAIAIFSILALGANALLVNVTNSNELSAQRAQQLEELQRAMMIIERDFLQMQERVPRTQGIENNLVINGGEFEFESDDYGIGFVRGGWQNPQLRLKRSHLQNVAYRLQENRLERLHTNYVDSVIGTEPKVRVLLSEVTQFKVEVLQDVAREFNWSETIVNTQLPAAVAITIETETFGEIRRVFKVKI